MSYCRNNGEDSDVYIIGNDAALECCGCSLYKYSFQSRKYSVILAHLEKHRKAGEKVPARAFTRLKKERDETKDAYVATNKRNLQKNIPKSRNELLEQKLYREMEYHRKELATTALEVFEDIYGRKPNSLELSGLAKTADIEMDLIFSRFG